MTSVAVRVVTQKREGARRKATPFLVARVEVHALWFGSRRPTLIALKTRTICLTGQYPRVGRSDRSLTIDGKAVKTPSAESIKEALAGGDPAEWEWYTDK